MKQVAELIKKSRLAQVLVLIIIAVAAADAGFYFIRAVPAARKVQMQKNRMAELELKTRSETEQYGLYNSYGVGLQQLEQFKAMLPERGDYIGVIKNVYKLAKEDGMKSASFGTDTKEIKEGDLIQVSFSMPISGTYRDVRKFIYDIETSPLFLDIDNLSLSSGGEEGVITLTIALTTYMRS